MIEAEMVHRMARRGALLAPAVVVTLWALGGTVYALSAALGLLFAVANLWVTGRVLGGVAESNPQMLMAVGMATFIATLVILTAVAVLLKEVSWVSFPVMGLTLVCSHLVLVIWEAAGGLGSDRPGNSKKVDAGKVRS